MASPTVKLPFAGKTSSKSKEFIRLEGLESEVDALISKNRELKVLTDATDLLKDKIRGAALPSAVQGVKEGKDLGVSVVGTKGNALVTWKNDFRTGADITKVGDAIGVATAKELFKQKFKLLVDGDLLVKTLGVAKTTKFVAELSDLFDKHGVGEAIAAKEDFVPESVESLFEVLSQSKVERLLEVFKVSASVTAK